MNVTEETNSIENTNPILLAFYSSFFTWGGTALGAAMVFILPVATRRFLDTSLGFASGIMLAASFWSLLIPAVEAAKLSVEKYAFVTVSIGFSMGIAFVYIAEKFLPNDITQLDAALNGKMLKETDLNENLRRRRDSSVSREKPSSNTIEIDITNYHTPKLYTYQRRSTTPPSLHGSQESCSHILKTDDRSQSLRRIFLLVLVIIIHNIPEGLAGGVAFGSIGQIPTATFHNAVNLAMAIALHNFPEGLAVSLPLAGYGWPKWKAFLLGQLSGMVEPIATLPAALGVMLLKPILPYAYSFAAGAMIYVVFDDLMPEAQAHGNGRLASLGAMFGFMIMMCLEIGIA